MLRAHRAIESITLDREAAHLKDELMPRYAKLIYNGYWWSPERKMLQAAIEGYRLDPRRLFPGESFPPPLVEEILPNETLTFQVAAEPRVPGIARIQAVVQAQGWVITEDLKVRDGYIQNPYLSTYLIPTVVDVPDRVDSVILEIPDPRGPWGARGMAEMPFLPLAPAIAEKQPLHHPGR